MINNYCQIVPQTWEERYSMYMKFPKEDLAKMLAERDRFDIPQACKEYYEIK